MTTYVCSLPKDLWTIVDRNKGRIIDFRVGNDNIENANLLMYNLLSNDNKIDLAKEVEKEKKKEKGKGKKRRKKRKKEKEREKEREKGKEKKKKIK